MNNNLSHQKKGIQLLRKTALLSGRVFVLYLAVYFFLPVIHFHKAIYNAQMATLSRLRPNYEYIKKYERKEVAYDAEVFKEYEYYYRKVVEFMPDRSDALGLLGYITFQQGRIDRSLEYYKEAIQIHPQLFNFLYNAGVLLFKTKNYAAASEFLKESVKRDVDRNVYLTSISVVYLPLFSDLNHLKRFIIGRFRQAYTNAYKVLVLSLFQIKDYPEVERYAAQGMQMRSGENAFFLLYRGIAAYHLGKYSLAVSFLQQSADIDPHQPETYYYLGLVLERMGKKALSGPLLTQAIRMHKENPQPDPAAGIDLILY